MYHVKPFYNTNDTTGIDTSGIAYAVRPVYSTPPASSSAPSVDVSKMDLLTRQDHLISSLETQIQRVDKLLTDARVSIQATAKTPMTQAHSSTQGAAPISEASSLPKINVNWPTDLSYPLDIVLQADPTRPPMLPWALQKFLGQDVVMVRAHVHSSCKSPLPSVPNDNANTNRTNASVKIIFTIIFRNVPDTVFMVDPVAQTGVAGEANLLRYLCRVFPLFPSVGVFEETTSDYYLDLVCSSLVGANRSKKGQTALKAIDEALAKKNGRLVCDKVTPADFCLLAALEKVPAKEIPGNVQRWRSSVVTAF